MRKAKHGFTLVELLVVIGIIAVLIGILLPALSRARMSAYKTQCASNLHQFFLADLQYVNNTKGWHFPGYWGVDANDYNRQWPGIQEFREGTTNPIIETDTTLNPGGNFHFCYVLKRWYCPLAGRGLTPSIDVQSGAVLFPMNYSTGMNVEGVDVGSALDSSTAPYADDSKAPTGSVNWAFHGYKDSMVRRPAEKLMFVDASWITVNESGSGVSPGWNGKISNYDIIQDRTNTGTIAGVGAYDSTRTTDWRHQGYANVCFFDGHVQGLRKDEIYNLDSSGNIVGNDALWKVMQ